MKKTALYYTAYCPFCQKVLMFLRSREHQIELRSTFKRQFANELVQGGGKSQVPCLRIDHYAENGGALEQSSWLYESDDIIQYIREHKLAA